MVTRPATAPEQKPRTLAFPLSKYSATAQPNDATLAAKVVVRKAFAATPSAASADPALNPYHPTQSIPVPTIQSTMLCGGMASLFHPIRLPRMIQAVKADHPEAISTTKPPAKSIARIPAAEFHTPFIHPVLPHTMCARGK